MSDTQIRRLVETDWAEFESVESDSFEHDRINIKEFTNLTNEAENNGFKGIFRNNIMVGYILLRIFKNTSHLNRIGVGKKYRKQGMADLLMEETVRLADNSHVDRITLFVETRNSNARSLYEKHGFENQLFAWHYIIQRNELSKLSTNDNMILREITLSELKDAINIFPNLELEKMKKQLLQSEDSIDKKSNLFLGLFETGELKGFARFNPNFSGCMPFKIVNLSYIDSFLVCLIPFMKDNMDVLRITFENYSDLSELFHGRGYRLFHEMVKMKKSL